MGVLEAVCSPGADLRAVSYRRMQLAVLSTVPLDDVPEMASLLAPLRQNGELTDAAMKVGARFRMKWMALGTREQMPFDLEAFLAEVQKESEGGV